MKKFTQKQFAQRLGMREERLQQWAKEGRLIPEIKEDGVNYYSNAQLEWVLKTENACLLDMSDTPINERPNIGVEDMDDYVNGGLTVEETHENGASIYIPYGVFNDVFDAIEEGRKAIYDQINEMDKLLREMDSEHHGVSSRFSESMREKLMDKVQYLEEKAQILECILPLGDAI